MKKLTLLALLVLLFGGCTKNYYNASDDKQTYHIDGITNVTLSRDNPYRNVYLQVTYLGSAQESITLSLEGVPAGLSAKITNPTGYPTFSTQVTYYDSSAAVGTYTVNLVATGKVSGRRVLPFTVKIEAVPDCSAPLAGAWTGTNFCNPGSSSFTESISTVASVPNRIQLNNFENSGITVYADISCLNRTIIMPAQTVNGVTYSGSGNYNIATNSYLRISYTKVTSSGSQSCQEYLNR